MRVFKRSKQSKVRKVEMEGLAHLAAVPCGVMCTTLYPAQLRLVRWTLECQASIRNISRCVEGCKFS